EREGWYRAALSLGIEPCRDLDQRDDREGDHERRHQPERTAPPMHRREDAADHRPAEMAAGESALRDCEDTRPEPRVVEAGDERCAAARHEAAGPALDAARGDQAQHIGCKGAAERAE